MEHEHFHLKIPASHDDFEKIVSHDLFEYAKTGNLQAFKELVMSYDIKCFPRKKYPTPQFTRVFEQYDRELFDSYLTPLHVAV
jgi:hypothetical protein